jgi:hypothetical protein
MKVAELTDRQKVALLRHLAEGKTPHVVGVILRMSETKVVDVAKNHGYPDRENLAWAADILERKLDEQIDEKPLAGGAPVERTAPRPIVAAPAGPSSIPAASDVVMSLVNAGKAHSSKRIQAAANRVLDDVTKLRALLREDDEKHAERRKAQAAKSAARAEVERLEKQLREAKAKLRGSSAAKPPVNRDGSAAHACTVGGCGRTFVSAQGLALHRTRIHASAA